MKKELFSLVLLGCAVLFAEELHVANPDRTLGKEWQDGTMTGKNSCSAIIEKKKYPDAWQFFYIEKGSDYKDAVLKPLIAIDPNSKGAKTWKESTPILAAKIREDGGFEFPAVLKKEIVFYQTSRTYGGAYSFTNPLGKKANLYVEGHLEHEKTAKIFVYIQKKDGSRKLLSDDSNPKAVLDYGKGRHYLKLMMEDVLEPGESIVFMAFIPQGMGKYISKAMYPIKFTGWGDAWNPILSLEVE